MNPFPSLGERRCRAGKPIGILMSSLTSQQDGTDEIDEAAYDTFPCSKGADSPGWVEKGSAIAVKIGNYSTLFERFDRGTIV